MRDIFRSLHVRVRDPQRKYLTPQHHAMSLVYRGLRTLHYMDLPSAARRLKANFSGVISFDFSIDVVANTVFGSHETKKTYQDLVSCYNGNK